jgi:1-acyl-sn-glycerol-3-phosphate acyltransferase
VAERSVGQLYTVARSVLEPTFNFMWDFHIEGREHVPTEGPAIFCPNHTSVLDSFFLPIALPRRITYVGKAEYMDSWKTKYLFPALGMIPIDRSGGSASERALNAAARVLEAGEYFGIYPEGTRSRDGRLYRGRTGVAQLALTSGAPIVPVGLRDTDKLQPVGSNRPRLVRVTVTFGEPIDVQGQYDGVPPGRARREITDRVMAAIAQLTGQEQAGVYNERPPES